MSGEPVTMVEKAVSKSFSSVSSPSWRGATSQRTAGAPAAVLPDPKNLRKPYLRVFSPCRNLIGVNVDVSASLAKRSIALDGGQRHSRLEGGVWFRRGRLFIVSPDLLAQRARLVKRQKLHLSTCSNLRSRLCCQRAPLSAPRDRLGDGRNRCLNDRTTRPPPRGLVHDDLGTALVEVGKDRIAEPAPQI